jgi:hypothetical protein
MVVHMKQFELLLQSLASSAIVAIAIWATVGAPPHQISKAQFNVASRR